MSRKRKGLRAENLQFLLINNANYTISYYADHTHDSNCYFAGVKPTPMLVNDNQQLKSAVLSMDFARYKEIYFERSSSCS